MTKKCGAPLLLGALVSATVGATAFAQAAPSRAGSISGVVTLEPPPPPRRTANRYADGGARPVQLVQQLPPVVYLRGPVPGATPQASALRQEMAQNDTAFVPSVIVVPVGGTVSFPNGDPFFHNVHSYSDAKRFDLGRYPEGETKDVVFDEPGVIDVYCEVHDIMRGAIIVTENPFHAIVGEDGTFSIAGVPPGEYTLVAWHADHRNQEQSVTVREGADTRLEVELRR